MKTEKWFYPLQKKAENYLSKNFFYLIVLHNLALQ